MDWMDRVDSCDGGMKWLTGLDWKIAWINSMDGLNQWTGWMDWIGGLDRWSETVDWRLAIVTFPISLGWVGRLVWWIRHAECLLKAPSFTYECSDEFWHTWRSILQDKPFMSKAVGTLVSGSRCLQLAVHCIGYHDDACTGLKFYSTS